MRQKIKTWLLVLALSAVASACSRKPATLTDEYDQKEMDAAIAKARSTVDDFIVVLNQKGADSFFIKAPITDANGTEYFWVSDVTYSNGTFVGKIGNEPGIVKNVKEGQVWSTQKAEVADWMYMKGDRIHGGYTIDPLLASMPKDQAARMRSQLVR